MTPAEITDETLAEIADPAQLLTLAWELEPLGRWTERGATLDRLEQLLASGPTAPAPPGRSWKLELDAERAIDTGRGRELEQAQALVERVLEDADPSYETAIARALLARGQAFSWVGTDDSVRAARRAFTEAARRFGELPNHDWQASAMLRHGYSGCYQQGDLVAAEQLIAQALATYPPESAGRRAGALGSYADVLIDLGELDRAEEVLREALAHFALHPNPHRASEISWGLARVAAGRGDAHATERLIREAEIEAARSDWYGTHIGLSSRLEGAELLDRVGLDDLARGRYEGAVAQAGEADEEVMQTGGGDVRALRRSLAGTRAPPGARTLQLDREASRLAPLAADRLGDVPCGPRGRGADRRASVRAGGAAAARSGWPPSESRTSRLRSLRSRKRRARRSRGSSCSTAVR